MIAPCHAGDKLKGGQGFHRKIRVSLEGRHQLAQFLAGRTVGDHGDEVSQVRIEVLEERRITLAAGLVAVCTQHFQ